MEGTERENFIARISREGYIVGEDGTVTADANYRPDYAQRRLQMAEIRRLKRKVVNGETLDDTELQQLKQYASDYADYYERTDKESDNARATLEQLKVGLDIEGIQDLEHLGEVAEGTSDMLQRLQKNGSIKLKAEVELISGGYQLGQNGAKLLNGTHDDQVEAIS